MLARISGFNPQPRTNYCNNQNIAIKTNYSSKNDNVSFGMDIALIEPKTKDVIDAAIKILKNVGKPVEYTLRKFDKGIYEYVPVGRIITSLEGDTGNLKLDYMIKDEFEMEKVFTVKGSQVEIQKAPNDVELESGLIGASSRDANYEIREALKRGVIYRS